MAKGTVLVLVNFVTRSWRSHRISRAMSTALLLISAVVCCFSVGCATGVGSGVNSAAQQNQAATGTGVVAPQFFGMVVKSVTQQPAVPVGSRRLWDSGVSWAQLEPAPGVFNWSTLDQEVASAQGAGLEVTLTLGMTPAWASSEPALASSYGLGATAMPANLADWDRYVTAVVTRYKGRIAFYEVWNNPTDATYWSGASAQLGSDMAQLSAHAAADVHTADAGAKLVAPALDAQSMAQFLAAGADSSVDVYAGAFSLAGQAPEAAVAEIQSLRSAMLNTNAETKPLWNDQPSWTLPSASLSAADQAAYAARALVLNAAFGVSRLSWYAWDENANTALQLTDSNGGPTDAAIAYNVMEGWLSGAAINGCSASAAQMWSCQLVRDGRPAWILWDPSGSVQASGMGMSTITDLEGNQQAIGAAGSVTVGAAPVLLQ
jgi:hypothetical protein